MTAVTLMIAALAIVLLSADEPAAQRPASQLAGGIRPASAPPVDFTLRDEHGRRVRAADARGRPAIVTFLYSSCQNECPSLAASIRLALDRLPRGVPVFAVSVDPARDSQAARARFLGRHYLVGRMHFLSGSTAELQRVWRAFGIQPQERGREHSAAVVVLDGSGHQRSGFPVGQLTPEGLAHDVRALAASS